MMKMIGLMMMGIMTMSKVIKFRGISVVTREWVYGFYLEDPFFKTPQIRLVSPNPKGCYIVNVIPESVGEFTGLTDNTKWIDRPKEYKDVKEEDWEGVPIFEGDIIAPSRESHHSNSDIYYEEHESSFMLRADECEESIRLNRYICGKDYAVIGNKSQNPELLEVV